MNTGKPYIQAKFEAEVAPLITIGRAKFEIIPFDGDPTNTDLSNILLSGPGKQKGLNRENAVKNEILRLEYDPEYGDFSYIYKENGANQELRYKNFEALRSRVAQARHLHGLKNKKYLLTVAEYTRLYDDYVNGRTPPDDANFDICSYKYEQIVWNLPNDSSKIEQIRERHVEILFSGAWRSDVSSRRLVDTMLIRIRVIDETSTKNFDDFGLYEQNLPYLCGRVMLKSSLPGASELIFMRFFTKNSWKIEHF